MSGRGRAATAGRWGLVVVVLVLLVVPGRLLAAEHDRDDALVPYAGQRAGGRVVPGQTWHVDAGVVSVSTDPMQVVEVRPRITVDTAEADITVRLCRPVTGNAVDRSTAPIADECPACHWIRARIASGHQVTATKASATPRACRRRSAASSVCSGPPLTSENSGTGSAVGAPIARNFGRRAERRAWGSAVFRFSSRASWSPAPCAGSVSPKSAGEETSAHERR